MFQVRFCFILRFIVGLHTNFQNSLLVLDILHALDLLILLLVVTLESCLEFELLIEDEINHFRSHLWLVPCPHYLNSAQKSPGRGFKTSAKITAEVLEVLDLPHEHETVTASLVSHVWLLSVETDEERIGRLSLYSAGDWRAGREER